MSPDRPRHPHGAGQGLGAQPTPGWRGLLVLLVVLGIVLAGCSGTGERQNSKPPATTSAQQRAGTPPATTSAQQSPPAGATLSDLADLGQLKALFNQQQGQARLLLLLSPT